jgi:hypothetical protein
VHWCSAREKKRIPGHLSHGMLRFPLGLTPHLSRPSAATFSVMISQFPAALTLWEVHYIFEGKNLRDERDFLYGET